jgi:hypothetical protein
MEPMEHMGPINATVRFVCELVALSGITAGVWTWAGSIPATIAAPVAAAVAWGVFRVPGDPGPAPVAVPGVVRLAIEFLVFGSGIAGVWATAGRSLAVAFFAVVVVHYVTTPRRLRHVLSSRR